MSTGELGIILALLLQTAAVAYWGGNLQRMVKVHDREILKLRAARDEHATTLTEHSTRLDTLTGK